MSRSDAGRRVPGVRNHLAYAQGMLLDEAVVPGSVRSRHRRLYEPHVARLNRWAEDVAVEEGRRVPFFDPESGGQDAPILALLQDPSAVAAHGSRLISRHNNDATAHNTHRTATAAGLGVERTVHWNVVPWWVADPAVPAGEKEGLAAAARRARPHLRTLLGLLPAVRVVLLLGKHAQRAWDASGIDVREVSIVRAPHPSPLAFNKVDAASAQPNAELLADAFRRAARHVG